MYGFSSLRIDGRDAGSRPLPLRRRRPGGYPHDHGDEFSADLFEISDRRDEIAGSHRAAFSLIHSFFCCGILLAQTAFTGHSKRSGYANSAGSVFVCVCEREKRIMS